MAAVATDLPFLTSGARVGMPRDMLAPKGIELTRLPGRLIGGEKDQGGVENHVKHMDVPTIFTRGEHGGNVHG